MKSIVKDKQYYKFCGYGFLKNFRFFDAFLILFLVEKGLPYTQIGILYAIREIFIYVFEIPSGIIADSYGRKNTLIASLFAYISSFVIFYISSDFWFFLGAFIFYGVGDAFRSGTHKGMIMDYLKINQWEDQKIDYYGHTRSWSQKGSALSALIAGLIVFHTGSYQYIFLYSIIPYLLNLFLILSYPNELNLSSDRNELKQKVGIRIILRSFVENIKQAQVLRIISTSAIHSAYLKAVKDYIQPLMLNIALIIPFMLAIEQEKKIGIVVGVIYFFIFLLTSSASRLSSKIFAKRKQKISHLSLVVGFSFGVICGLFFHFDLWVFSLIAFVGIYIIENIRKPILTGFIADHVPNEILTSVLSTQSLLSAFITAILAIAFGLFADNFGIGVSFMAISGLLLVFSFLVIVFKPRQE